MGHQTSVGTQRTDTNRVRCLQGASGRRLLVSAVALVTVLSVAVPARATGLVTGHPWLRGLNGATTKSAGLLSRIGRWGTRWKPSKHHARARSLRLAAVAVTLTLLAAVHVGGVLAQEPPHDQRLLTRLYAPLENENPIRKPEAGDKPSQATPPPVPVEGTKDSNKPRASPSYKEKGVTYYLKNVGEARAIKNSGQKLRGLASWYGRDFHGKKTSNGEIYDMYAMTAAHKTLPPGTVVRVKKIETGQFAVVRINDRGPFVRGRVIDLSYSAAREAGVADPGTAEVEIEILKLPPKRSKKKLSMTEAGRKSRDARRKR